MHMAGVQCCVGTHSVWDDMHTVSIEGYAPIQAHKLGAHLLSLDASCRFSVHQVCQLLQDLGLQDTSSLQSNGVNGGELLELSDEEIREDLGLSRLQASCNTPLPWNPLSYF